MFHKTIAMVIFREAIVQQYFFPLGKK